MSPTEIDKQASLGYTVCSPGVTGFCTEATILRGRLKCPQCGYPNLEGITTCFKCGSNVSPPVEPEEKTLCSRCKMVLEEGWVSCPRCGPAKKPKGGLNRSAAVLSVILLVVGIVMTVSFYNMDPSVVDGSDRINNIGLLADRQNGLILGIALTFISIILAIAYELKH